MKWDLLLLLQYYFEIRARGCCRRDERVCIRLASKRTTTIHSQQLARFTTSKSTSQSTMHTIYDSQQSRALNEILRALGMCTFEKHFWHHLSLLLGVCIHTSQQFIFIYQLEQYIHNTMYPYSTSSIIAYSTRVYKYEYCYELVVLQYQSMHTICIEQYAYQLVASIHTTLEYSSRRVCILLEQERIRSRDPYFPESRAKKCDCVVERVPSPSNSSS